MTSESRRARERWCPGDPALPVPFLSCAFLTGCPVSAVTAACVGHREIDGLEHYLNVTDPVGSSMHFG